MDSALSPFIHLGPRFLPTLFLWKRIFFSLCLAPAVINLHQYPEKEKQTKFLVLFHAVDDVLHSCSFLYTLTGRGLFCDTDLAM